MGGLRGGVEGEAGEPSGGGGGGGSEGTGDGSEAQLQRAGLGEAGGGVTPGESGRKRERAGQAGRRCSKRLRGDAPEEGEGLQAGVGDKRKRGEGSEETCGPKRILPGSR